MHHTKDKGDIGVLKAQVDLAEQGYMVLLPLTEHAKFDLVAYKDGVFKRVQVKYRTVSNGTVQIQFSSCWADKHGTHIVPVDKSEVDLYCVYVPETDKCYYFDPAKFNKSVRLRVVDSKNNQKKKVNLLEEYRKVV